MDLEIAMVDIRAPGTVLAGSTRLDVGHVHQGFLGRFQQAIGKEAPEGKGTELREQVKFAGRPGRVRIAIRQLISPVSQWQYQSGPSIRALSLLRLSGAVV